MNQESEKTVIHIRVTKDDERPSRKIRPSELVVIFQTCHLVLKKRRVHSQKAVCHKSGEMHDYNFGLTAFALWWVRSSLPVAIGVLVKKRGKCFTLIFAIQLT